MHGGLSVCVCGLLSLEYTLYVSKNDTDVAHYNFDAHQPILTIFGRDVAERVCYPTSPN